MIASAELFVDTALYFGLSALAHSSNLVTQGVALGWDRVAPLALNLKKYSSKINE